VGLLNGLLHKVITPDPERGATAEREKVYEYYPNRRVFSVSDADQLDNYLTDYLDDAKHNPQRLKACFRASKLKLPKRIRTLAG
jgi:hypothetical protein